MVYVRAEGAEASGGARACDPAALAAEGGSVQVGATTPLASSEGGPFEPAAVALERDGVLRDRLAAALRPPSLAPWARVRLVALAMAAAPALFLLELDRELTLSGQVGGGRLAVDAALAAYLGWELTRRTPRMPGVAAAALVAIALRFALVVSRLCGHAHALVWAALVLASSAAGLVLWRAPSRERLALELQGRMGIARADGLAARLPPDASGALVTASIAAALGLPALVYVMRKAGLDLGIQAVGFGAYGMGAPTLVRRALDRGARGEPGERPRAARLLLASFTGLALAGALMSGASHFFDAGAEIARCANKLDAEAKRVLAREAAEIASGVARVRGSGALALMILAVVPIAEERLYRDLLMRVLVRKYGSSYGLLASSVVFGFAHFGVYEVALYQTVLLGLAFGVAWAEGGVVAAAIVHAAWNGILLW